MEVDDHPPRRSDLGERDEPHDEERQDGEYPEADGDPADDGEPAVVQQHQHRRESQDRERTRRAAAQRRHGGLR